METYPAGLRAATDSVDQAALQPGSRDEPLFTISEGPTGLSSRYGYPVNAAVGKDGHWYVLSNSGEIARLNARGQLLDRWRSAARGDGRRENEPRIAASPSGAVWSIARDGNVDVFDAIGVAQARWWLPKQTQVLDASGVDGEQLLVLAENGEVMRLDVHGREIDRWSVPGLRPRAIAAHEDWGVWLFELPGGRIVRTDRSGQVLAERDGVPEPWPDSAPPDRMYAAVNAVGAMIVRAGLIWYANGPEDSLRPVQAQNKNSFVFDEDGSALILHHALHGWRVTSTADDELSVIRWFAPGYLPEPGLDIAAASDGHYVVLSPSYVATFDPFGRSLGRARTQWAPAPDADEAGAGRQYRIALAPDGSRWICTTQSLLRVSIDGRVLGERTWDTFFDTRALGPAMQGCAMDTIADGAVLLFSQIHARLVRIDESLQVADSWTMGALEGMEAPDLAVLSDGTIAIVESSLRYVLRVSEQGVRLPDWPLPESFVATRVAASPAGGALFVDQSRAAMLQVDSEGRVQSMRPTNAAVTQFAVAANGDFLTLTSDSFGLRSSANGHVRQDWHWDLDLSPLRFGGVAVDNMGRLLASTASGRLLRRYGGSGQLQAVWPAQSTPSPILSGQDMRRLEAKAADSFEGLSVSSETLSRLASPPAVAFGLDRASDGRICAPRVGRVNAILCYAPDGTPEEALESGPRSETLEFMHSGFAADVAFGLDDTLWVVEGGAGRMRGFREDGAILSPHPPPGVAEDTWYPTGIAVAPDGTIVVSDQAARPLARYDARGRYLHGIGGSDPALGGLQQPSGVSVAAGRIDVADDRAQRVASYALNGEFLGTWAARSASWPLDVARAADGRAYVGRFQGVDVYEADDDRRWAVAIAAHAWSSDDPVWRDMAADVRVPGPQPPWLHVVADPVWQFRRRIVRERDDGPLRRWRIDATGRVRLRAGDHVLLDAHNVEPTTYFGSLPLSLAGRILELDYQPRGGVHDVELSWTGESDWHEVNLPYVVR